MSMQDLLKSMREVDNSPVGREIDLRMSFSLLVIRKLRELGWSQKRLAEELGKAESFVSRVLCGHENCTFKTAGKILFAIGAKPEIIEVATCDEDQISVFGIQARTVSEVWEITEYGTQTNTESWDEYTNDEDREINYSWRATA